MDPTRQGHPCLPRRPRRRPRTRGPARRQGGWEGLRGAQEPARAAGQAGPLCGGRGGGAPGPTIGAGPGLRYCRPQPGDHPHACARRPSPW